MLKSTLNQAACCNDLEQSLPKRNPFEKVVYRWVCFGLLISLARIVMAALWPIVGLGFFTFLDFIFYISATLFMPALLVWVVAISVKQKYRLLNGAVLSLLMVTVGPFYTGFTTLCRHVGQYFTHVRVEKQCSLKVLDTWAETIFSTPQNKLKFCDFHHVTSGRLRSYGDLDPSIIPPTIRAVPTNTCYPDLSFTLYALRNGDKVIAIHILNTATESSTVLIAQRPLGDDISFFTIWHRSTRLVRWNNLTYGVFQYDMIK